MKDFTRNELFVSLGVSFSMLMITLDASIVDVAIPTLLDYFNVDSGIGSRIVLIYLIAITTTTLFFGQISDLFGKKKVFVTGYLLFSISSFLCFFSPSLIVLLILRFFQGIGAAMLFATAKALLVIYLKPEIRGRAFGIWMLYAGIGLMTGSFAGGFIVEYLGWRWVFLVNFIPALAGIIISLKALKKKEIGFKGKLPLDLKGMLYSFIMISSLIYSLNMGQEFGWLSVNIIVLLSISISFLLLFIFHEKRFNNPLVRFSMLKDYQFSFGLISKITSHILRDGFLFIFPLFFARYMNFQPEEYGIILTIFPLSSLIISPLAGYFSDRIKAKKICVFASIFLVFATILFLFFTKSSSIIFIAFAMIIYGIGFYSFMTPNIKLMMSHASLSKEGMISSLASMSKFFGAVLGVTIFETIYSYNLQTSENILNNNTSNPFYYTFIVGLIVAFLTLIASVIASEKAN
ncbi:MAG: MFS transporter [Bacteroidales bacterium]|nr:MFS transporter [Bacteroidales bacterium]